MIPKVQRCALIFFETGIWYHNLARIIWRTVLPVCSCPMAHAVSNAVCNLFDSVLYEVINSGVSFWGMGLFFHMAEKHFFLVVGNQLSA